MAQAKYNFPGSSYGPQPMSKNLDFDEGLSQNTTFRARHMDPSQCANSGILMNGSAQIQFSGLALWTPTCVQTAGF